MTPLPGTLVGYDAGSLSRLPRPALQEPGVERAAAPPLRPPVEPGHLDVQALVSFWGPGHQLCGARRVW